MGLFYVKHKPIGRMPPFRKVAMGTWQHPGDPQIYGILEVDLTKADEWLARQPADAPRVTVTHMVTRAAGLAMARHPDLNGLIRFRKIYLRQSVDIACLAAVEHEGGRMDLASVKVEHVDQKSVFEIAADMAAKLERLRQKRDLPVQKSAKLLSLLPGFMVRFMLWLTAFIGYTLNLKLPGLPPDLFGGTMITNVGVFGLDVAFAPLVPYSRTPLLMLIGEAKKRPVVVEGDRIEARRIVTINATIDHRFCDGALLAKMVKVVKEVFADPDQHFGRWTPPAAPHDGASAE